MRTCGVVSLVVATVFAVGGAAQRSDDPLKAVVERWKAYLRDNTSANPDWTQIKGSVQPGLERAEQAVRDGRRLLALVRLAPVQENLGANEYMMSRPDSARDVRGFEREWERMGGVLREYLSAEPAVSLSAIRPAAARAVAEAAAAKVRIYYDASLDYGRNTAPQYGLFYLGAAQAQRDVVELSRGYGRSTGEARMRAAPPLRSLRPELDALEGDLLRAYRPPASVDRHSDFIAASAALKEARELDALALRHGALLRYLQAAARVAPIRADPLPVLEAPALAERLRDLDSRLSGQDAGRPADHTIARVLLEQAQAEAASAAAGRSPSASVIVTDVAPRYFAALGPAAPSPPASTPRVTVTLVRWPYT
jgi:hypothetical protein